LLLIYLLDLSAVAYISGILIHEKYIAIDFSEKEIVGNAYVHVVRGALTDVAMAGAGQRPPADRFVHIQAELDRAEQQYGGQLRSRELSGKTLAALDRLAQAPATDFQAVGAAIDASRALITRVGNQSNLILDPDLDSYYVMSMSILRYPALLAAVDSIGALLREEPPRSREEARSRYLVLEGQFDAVLEGLRSDFAEAGAANPGLASTLDPLVSGMLGAVDAYRLQARRAIEGGNPDDPARQAAGAAQRQLIGQMDGAWRVTGDALDGLLRERVQALFSRMWLHLGTALFLLCAILCLVYLVAQQISRPLRQLARVMDTVRRTGDPSRRAVWDSHDEIGQVVRGFNEMLQQLDHERDVQKELAATARAAEAQQALVEATPVPMLVTAIPGHEVLHANGPAQSWLSGRDADPWGYALESSVRARFFQQLSDVDAIDEFEVLWRTDRGATWAMLSARRLKFQGQDAILTAFTPITQIKLLEQRLELWAKVFEASSEAILILDEGKRVLSANAAFYRSTGYNAADVGGLPPGFLATGSGATVFAEIGQQVERLGTWSGEAYVRRLLGGDYPAWLMASAVRDHGGEITHYICTLIDITDRKKSEAHIRFLAEHDALTQLPNRSLFVKRLGAVLDEGQTGHRFAVLFIDLDRFKDINDTLGHHVGDGLLRSVSQRLLRAVRGGDMVSRLGGDEFTVVLTEVGDREDVERLINGRLIPLVREPHQINGATLQVACSVGVAMYPEDGADIETLMQNADAAMYQAKAEGRNLVRFFSQEMAERTRRRLAIEAGLRSAIGEGEFVMVFQPCVDAVSGALVSVEGLLRWNSAQLGSVEPSLFVPIAEETRLILPIGAWVIDQACRQITRWRVESGLRVRVSINVSAIQLRDSDLVEALSSSLAAHSVEPDQIELEITETVLMDSTDKYLHAIRAVRALGVSLSLDDFGTGYSSLSYLNRFPLDRLKIDRAFVHDMLDAPSDLAVIRAIIDLGHELGLRVVAEGVESAWEAETLRSIGCDELQGYLYGRPLAAQELVRWIQERQAAGGDKASDGLLFK
jgi:diguanylate cyclase (GGDEF)-like protein/PAS domain S-box-containing protein